MRKFLSAILSAAVIMSAPAAVNARDTENYEYILPPEFLRIDIIDTYDGDDLAIVYDKSEKCALYNIKGEKLSGDYDNIMLINDFQYVFTATRDGITDILHADGQVTASYDKKVIGADSAAIFLDLSDNSKDDRPISYYEGQFGIYDYYGNQRAVLDYDKYNPERNSGYSLTYSGYSLVFKENGKFGTAVLDSYNNIYIGIEPVYDKIYPFTYLSPATIAIKDGKYGLLSSDGTTPTGFIYDDIQPLYTDSSEIYAYMFMQDGLYGVISNDGTWVLKTPDERKPEGIYKEYSLIKVSVPNYRDDKNEYGSLYGLIDYKGNTVIPTEHTAIYGISNGIISAQKAYDQCGYYDLYGNELCEFKYRMVSQFADGLGFASGESGGTWFNDVLDIDGNIVFNSPNWGYGFYSGISYIDGGKFIDKTGNIVIDNPEWKIVSGCRFWDTTNNGIYVVETDNGCGLIKYHNPDNTEPKWDYEYIDFENVRNFTKTDEGYVFTTLDDKYIFVDKYGDVTDDAVKISGSHIFYDETTAKVYDDSNNLFLTFDTNEMDAAEYENYICTLSRGGDSRVLSIYSSKDGKLINEIKYSDFDFTQGDIPIINSNGYFIFSDGGKFGIADIMGNITVKAEYGDISHYADSTFSAYKDGIWKIIDETGGTIQEFKYPGRPYKHAGMEQYTVLDNDESTVILDENGNAVSELHGIRLGSIPCENALIIYDNSSNYRMSLIDFDGNTIIPFSEQYIEYLGDGIFKKSSSVNEEVINIDGKILAAECYDITDMGDNGYIGITQDNFKGYINSDGKAVLTLPDGYEAQGEFSEGLAPIVCDTVYNFYGDTSYINEQGEIMLHPTDKIWCKGNSFENGIAEVGINLGKAGPQGKNLVRCVFDTPSDWAKADVDTAIENGLVPLSQQERYRKNITREDFCEIAYELPIIQNALKNDDLKDAYFTDTENEKILSMCGLGIIEGVGDDRFAPDAFITREEAAVILSRIYSIYNSDTAPSDFIYDDHDNISDWAAEAIYKMRSAGIMNGVSDTKFSPKSNYTTEQSIVTILRLYNLI